MLTIDPNVAETFVAVTAREVDADVRALQELAAASSNDAGTRKNSAAPQIIHRILGFRGSNATVLDVATVFAFFTKNKTVYAHTASGEWQVKARMYELEASLPVADFVRISQSEIVRIAAIKNLDLSFSGTISVHLKDGSRYFVSRRQLSAFKAKLGM
ncbi:MAG: LytTR family transcriptional regulator [Arcanobacterium sp.]|nr:LytTR family transcriptional regulator [Arcanobacterium sp.]MDY5588582.1 LytTR family DNA-binding domain-containing protein [Arcanobacterium sp.]